MKIIITLLCSLLLASAAFADDKPYKQYGDTKVYYSVFNSSFVAPDIANLHRITRGIDKGLVNIAVVPDGAAGGTTALVTGTVMDLLARQQTLDFKEIREGESVYYLAPFEFGKEEPLTFSITVRPAGASADQTFTFQRTLYQDEEP